MDAEQIRAAARARFTEQLEAGLVPPIPPAAYGAVGLMRIETKQAPAKTQGDKAGALWTPETDAAAKKDKLWTPDS